METFWIPVHVELLCVKSISFDFRFSFSCKISPLFFSFFQWNLPYFFFQIFFFHVVILILWKTYICLFLSDFLKKKITILGFPFILTKNYTCTFLRSELPGTYIKSKPGISLKKKSICLRDRTNKVIFSYYFGSCSYRSKILIIYYDHNNFAGCKCGATVGFEQLSLNLHWSRSRRQCQ